MARMTFSKTFIRDLDWRTSVRFEEGKTYDVPDALIADVNAEQAAVPEVVPVLKADGAS